MEPVKLEVFSDYVSGVQSKENLKKLIERARSSA
jgi:hypothetical protein